MHSFHQSRGRILFDVFCALGMVVCCVGAWKQTGASALLGAAAVAGLHGFVRLFDLRHGRQALEPQRIDFASEEADEPSFDRQSDPVVEPARTVEEVLIAASDPVPEVEKPPVKTPRKKGARRAGAAKLAKVTELTAVADAPTIETAPVDELEFIMDSGTEEPGQPRIEQLFEPDPFFRQKRSAFGRRHTLR